MIGGTLGLSGALLDGSAERRIQEVVSGRAARTRPGVSFVDVGTAVLRVRDVGEGPETLVFATDPPVGLEAYDALLEKLGKRFRVIVFEPPGFGFSLARRGFDFSFDRSVDVVGRLLRNLRAGPYVLAFPCVMGFAAMGVAERWPLLVRKMVTMQAPAWGDALLWKARRDPHGLLQRPVVGQLAMRALRRERAPRWFRLAMPEGEAQEALARSTDRAFSHGASFGLASAFQRFLVGDVPFRTPTQPVLSVWGARDRSHPAPSQPVSGERVRAHVLEHAGHFPELEDPARFARLVTDFVLEGR